MIATLNPGQQAIREYYSNSELDSIANYGCESGSASGHIYYCQTWEFWCKFEDEIEDYFYNIFGEDWMTECNFIGPSIRQIVNKIVWAYVESTATMLLEKA